MANHVEDKTWTIPQIMYRIFSDDDMAQWLLSRDSNPPTTINADMMSNSFTADMCNVVEEKGGHFFKSKEEVSSYNSSDHSQEIEALDTSDRAGASGEKNSSHKSRNSSGNSDTDSSTSTPLKLSSAEKMVCVLHGTFRNRSYMSVTDSRTPFAFLEAPSEATEGVRRLVLDAMHDHLFMAMHYWLVNGNSVVIAVKYPLDSTYSIRRCVILIKPYPDWRYPSFEDVIESAIVEDMPNCQFCQFRGYTYCDCVQLSMKRPKSRVPANLTDPWNMWKYVFIHHDSGLKKERIILTNYLQGITIASEYRIIMNPTVGNSKEKHAMEYQHYLNSVRPLFNNRMLTWGMPNHAIQNKGQDSAQCKPICILDSLPMMNQQQWQDAAKMETSGCVSGELFEQLQEGATVEELDEVGIPQYDDLTLEFTADRPSISSYEYKQEYQTSIPNTGLRKSQQQQSSTEFGQDSGRTVIHPSYRSHPLQPQPPLSTYIPSENMKASGSNPMMILGEVEQHQSFMPVVAPVGAFQNIVQNSKTEFCHLSQQQPPQMAIPTAMNRSFGIDLRNVPCDPQQEPSSSIHVPYEQGENLATNASALFSANQQPQSSSIFIPINSGQRFGQSPTAGSYSKDVRQQFSQTQSGKLDSDGGGSSGTGGDTGTATGSATRDDDADSTEDRAVAKVLLAEADNLPAHNDIRCGCKLCGTSFTRKYDLKRHIKSTHLAVYKYSCPFCDGKFKKQHELDVHRRENHERSQLFYCDHCSKSFSSDSNRRRHIRTLHGTDLPP
eukprot:CAMPEP_0184695840 /NCGR_PEP_ID=MMETSP0313-20130426/3345_1 /TAXON_ID=2792 /ORGANISM="Porphyridium aerugineum, Strain SAG 1380-2" /LENGTH=776 /DNA_ID=CAMNT_0027154367 /DNA_START=3259 /DNA_END=5589 /DNA_ORIENTATION=-